MIWPFRKARIDASIEKRAAASGFTAEIIAARESYVSGRRGIGELTATAQAAVSMWEGGLALADVTGTDLLDRRTLALAARSMALRGEALFLIRDAGAIPAADWDLTTKDGKPVAYRVQVSEAGGGRDQTALAGEVLHFRIGADPAAPYYGQAPLRRANLTAGMLQAVETALAEVYELAPIGTAVLPFPEAAATDLESLARGFRGNRGKVMIRESVNVAAAGGPAPMADWKPMAMTPDLARAMTAETLQAAREAVGMAFGILPAMMATTATGPVVREGQRHLAQWCLQPIAALIGEEATDKLGEPVALDVMRPLQAYDAGGRARALSGIVAALAEAKAAGIDPGRALELVALADD